MNDTYDSTPDTNEHIFRVRCLIGEVIVNLLQRSDAHDQSKLIDPEKAIFDAVTPKLKGLTYGSNEYKASLAEMGEALAHHYAENSHHPEHYPNGINGMSLLDLVEMLCDWKAATERHADGSYTKSLEINRTRFGIDGQLFSVIVGTAKELEFVPNDWVPASVPIKRVERSIIRAFWTWLLPLLALAGTIGAVWLLWFHRHNASHRADGVLLLGVGCAYIIAILFLLIFTRRWSLRGLGQVATYAADAAIYIGLGGAGLGWWVPFGRGEANLIRSTFVVGSASLVLGLAVWTVQRRSDRIEGGHG